MGQKKQDERAAPMRVEYTNKGTRGTLHLDGYDVTTNVARVSFDHRAGELPQVYLELRQNTRLPEVVADCIVHVTETVHEDPADATLRFLEPLDPQEFERACLAAMELGGPATFGEAALYVLKGYAGGNVNGS